MVSSVIVEYACRLSYPFLIMFGVYIILFGDVSPGGGFQGGVFLATAQLVHLLIPGQTDGGRALTARLALREKLLFLALLASSVVFVTLGSTGVAAFPEVLGRFDIRREMLLLLNVLIGLKVGTGLVVITRSFLQEV